MSVLGPVVTLPRIERAVTAHVKLWLPTYLRAVEREEGVRADGVTELVPGTLPLPRSYGPTSGPVEKWPEAQLPAVIFGSPGLSDEGVRRDGSGLFMGTWVFGLTAVCSGNDATTTRWLAGLYVAALRLLCVQHPPSGGGLEIESSHWADEAYDELPFARSRSLMAGTCTFELRVGSLASARHGLPAPPPADPAADPGAFPEVETTHLDVERT